VFSAHIANASKIGDVHLSMRSQARFRELKKYFPNLPKAVSSNVLFCGTVEDDRWACASSSGYKHTEDPNETTCVDCLRKAKEFGYSQSLGEEVNGFRLSEHSFRNITNWIPDDCKIVVSSKGIEVVDSFTEETLKEKTIKRAATLAAEKCFKPFSSDFITKNDSYLSNDVYDYNNNKYYIQGVNFDSNKKEFNGLILKTAKSETLSNMTFTELFKLGFHLKDGTPCGDYVNDRGRFVDSEVSDGLGIGMIDLLQ